MFELIHNENNKKAPISLMKEYLECDKIILNASKNTKVIFHHLKENYDIPNRKAGFYNVNTGEDIELKQGQIHESEAIGYDDMNNGWIRYGILPSYEKENNCLRDCLKLFLVYFNLSLSEFSLQAKSRGFQTSPVSNM